MRVKAVIFVVVLILLFSALPAENITLVSESLPRLGDVADFYQYGDYGLFVGGTQHLAILDFNDPIGQPIAVFNIPQNYAKSYDVLCYGSYAYLFLWHSIYIISLQDIHHPVLMTTLDLSDTCRGRLIQGNYLYLASPSGSLSSYSLNNPLAPLALDTLELGVSNINYMVAGDGFIACQKDSLYLVDISNPADMLSCGSIAYADTTPDVPNSQIAALGSNLVCSSLNELKVYSLANPNNPNLLSSTTLDCSDLIFRTHIHDNVLWSLYFEGTTENGETGLMAIDISNPYSPVVSLKQSLLEIGWFDYRGRYMRASGNRMVFSLDYQPLKTATISGSSYVESEFSIPRYGSGNICANSNWIVGLNPFINVLNYRNDSSLFPIQQIEPETDSIDIIQLKDNLLLCAYTYTSSPYAYSPTLDIYNLQTGSKLSSFPLPTNPGGEFPTMPKSILIYEHNALLSNGLGGLVCVDISDPANPSQRFRIRDPFSSVVCAAVRGNELWLSTYVNMAGAYLCCYDISDFDSPVLKYEISLGDISPSNMLFIGNYLYVNFSGRFRCYHLGTEGILEQSDSYQYGSDMKHMLPLGKGLLLGDDRRMCVLSLKDPLHPVQTGYRDMEMVIADYPWDPPYPSVYYAVNNNNILVSNAYSLKCFDATPAIAMCSPDQDFSSEKLVIFPNPSREAIYIGFKTSPAVTAKVDVYNLRGQKVASQSFVTTAEEVSIKKLNLRDNSDRKLAAGVYIVRIDTGSTKLVSKFVMLN